LPDHCTHSNQTHQKNQAIMGAAPTPPSTTLAPIPFGTPTDTPTAIPTASPTISAAPTARSWEIGELYWRLVDGDSVFDGRINVHHQIGYNVKQNHTHVKLYDYNCENEVNKTGLAVYIQDVGSNFGWGSFYAYELGLNSTLIGSDTTFLFGDGLSQSADATGQVRCCTRISTYESNTHHGMLEAFYKETNFVFNYDLTQNVIQLGNVSVADANALDNFTADSDTDFSIDSYQCNNFVAVATPHAIIQNSNLVVCIEPSHTNNLDVVHITNFNLLISAGTLNSNGYLSFDAVKFGTTTWTPDPLTDVLTQGKIIMISVPIVAQFYLQGKNSVDVTGNAFLEFDSSKTDAPIGSFFNMEVDLEVETSAGCFSALLKKFRALI